MSFAAGRSRARIPRLRSGGPGLPRPEMHRLDRDEALLHALRRCSGSHTTPMLEPVESRTRGGIMSWQPAQDPVPGDRYSCDAVETIIVPRARDLGGFEVRRALPSTQRQMVGPF